MKFSYINPMASNDMGSKSYAIGNSGKQRYGKKNQSFDGGI